MIMKKIKAGFTVLREGEELSNSETWKNRQASSSAIISIIGAILVFIPSLGDYFSSEDIITIAGGLAALGGVLNSYITMATSKRVGLPVQNNSKSDDEGPKDAFGNDLYRG